jgi:hypothetical protein
MKNWWLSRHIQNVSIALVDAKGRFQSSTVRVINYIDAESWITSENTDFAKWLGRNQFPGQWLGLDCRIIVYRKSFYTLAYSAIGDLMILGGNCEFSTSPTGEFRCWRATMRVVAQHPFKCRYFEITGSH